MTGHSIFPISPVFKKLKFDCTVIQMLYMLDESKNCL